MQRSHSISVIYSSSPGTSFRFWIMPEKNNMDPESESVSLSLLLQHHRESVWSDLGQGISRGDKPTWPAKVSCWIFVLCWLLFKMQDFICHTWLYRYNMQRNDKLAYSETVQKTTRLCKKKRTTMEEIIKDVWLKNENIQKLKTSEAEEFKKYDFTYIWLHKMIKWRRNKDSEDSLNRLGPVCRREIVNCAEQG